MSILYIDLIYRHSLKEIADISKEGFRLNSYNSYEWKIFRYGISPVLSPSSETKKYLSDFIEKYEPIVIEKSIVSSWLLRCSNQLQEPDLAFLILPFQITKNTRNPCDYKIADSDLELIKQFKNDKELKLLKRRLLLNNFG